MKTKYKDKTRKPAKYLQDEAVSQDIQSNGLAKSMLLLVEGETEQAYFEKLKQNPWLIDMAGVKIEKVGDFKTAYDKEKADKGSEQIWFVTDNDKNNAFVLEANNQPFFVNLTDNQLPQAIRDSLNAAYNSDNHNYFLSIHDYLTWLREAIGVEETVMFWDRIQHFTPIKNREFEKFDTSKQTKIQLAYSCIAFEFWLILHFEQNQTPFLWVEKAKNEAIDVMTYFRSREDLCPNYEKGISKPCNAYTCLYQNFDKKPQTKDDEWQVLMRIIKAIKNAEWLRYQMLPILNRQSGKWFEVNPYIKGLDDLMKELLNIKPLRQPIDYFEMTVQFDFDIQNARLSFQIATENAVIINSQHKSCFEIKDATGNTFYPIINETIRFPNNHEVVNLQYEMPQPIVNQLILIFKDPRSQSKSSQLLFLLN
jgi:hypothetical protein